MSFAHWWFGLLLDQHGHERVKPGFAAAAEKAVLSPTATQALAAWRARPGGFASLGSHPADADVVNAFIGAFDAAMAYCGASSDDAARLRQVIDFLPDGLARAADAGQGFLALARAQI